jgi:hypothetical protein
VCSLLNLITYPKSVHFTSLTLSAEYWGSRQHMPPEQDHNHNLESVALNYPCPVRRLRIVRHNKARHRENEIREQSYFYLCCLCRSQHTFGPWTEAGPPGGAATRCFQAKWWAFLDLRHCLPEGSPRNVSKLSGRHSWIFSTTSHWVRHVTSSR